MHLRFLPGNSRCPTQGPAYSGSEVIRSGRSMFMSVHDFSTSLGRSPELS